MDLIHMNSFEIQTSAQMRLSRNYFPKAPEAKRHENKRKTLKKHFEKYIFMRNSH